MKYEELRDLWAAGDIRGVISRLSVAFLLPLEPWIRAGTLRRTHVGPVGPLHTPAPGFPEDLDITNTSRNVRPSVALVRSQLGDRVPAVGVIISLLSKTERNVYAHVSVGRSDNNDIVVDQPSVSRFHADFRAVEDSFVVRDAKSRNGTRRNGELLGDIPSPKLSSGDVISFGDAMYVFCLPNESHLAQVLGRLVK